MPKIGNGVQDVLVNTNGFPYSLENDIFPFPPTPHFITLDK